LATCNILDFKGLESKYIMVVGLENFNEDPGYIRILYTGITRANAVLWLAVPEAKQALIDKMRLKNFKSRDPL
jgi:superfamily I DNA/RNA helicase